MKILRQLEREKAELKQIIGNMNETLNNLLSFGKDGVFPGSNILFGEHDYGTLIKSWIGRTTTAKLCWRATRDGWASSTFHSNCDNKKPTVTLIKVGSYIFGGYATESWG
ncbi:Hypothetical predicted protein, partial [Paramuricea clavata]